MRSSLTSAFLTSDWEIRNCLAIADGLTPALKAARTTFCWPEVSRELSSGWRVFGAFARVGRRRRRSVSAVTAASSVPSSASSRCFSAPTKSFGRRWRGCGSRSGCDHRGVRALHNARTFLGRVGFLRIGQLSKPLRQRPRNAGVRLWTGSRLARVQTARSLPDLLLEPHNAALFFRKQKSSTFRHYTKPYIEPLTITNRTVNWEKMRCNCHA